MWRVVCAMSLCWMLTAAAYAETYNLTGTVKDPADHVVPTATIWAKSLASGRTYTARTNAEGDYTIANVPAGDYKVWAKVGELVARPVKVTLSAGQTTDLVVSPAAHRPPAHR